MNDSLTFRSVALGLLALLLPPAVGAGVGWFSGPALARTNYVVQVAERVALEETGDIEERTLQSEAFRATGAPPEKIYEKAREVIGRYRLGATIFGLWCGLAVGLKILAFMTAGERREYSADAARCVACGRCYMACPVHREWAGLGPVETEAPATSKVEARK